jgi:hypothetical protein
LLISPSISSVPIPTLGDSVVCLLAHRRWELLSASLFANDGIDLLVPLGGGFAHLSFDQQRADTDARRHYDGR